MYSLNESLAFLLNRAGTAMAAAFSQELKGLNLTVPMWRVLAALWSTGDQSLSGLSAVTSVEISTLSRQVATLVKRNYVSRTPSGIDWRAITIGLTPEGRRVVEQLLPAVERHEQAAFHDIGASDVRRLKFLLNKAYDNILALDRSLPTVGQDGGTENSA
jgi:DNA-binding MarR family transcriptional regulator